VRNRPGRCEYGLVLSRPRRSARRQGPVSASRGRLAIGRGSSGRSPADLAARAEGVVHVDARTRHRDQTLHASIPKLLSRKVRVRQPRGRSVPRSAARRVPDPRCRSSPVPRSRSPALGLTSEISNRRLLRSVPRRATCGERWDVSRSSPSARWHLRTQRRSRRSATSLLRASRFRREDQQHDRPR
jgi:hypothetical protein